MLTFHHTFNSVIRYVINLWKNTSTTSGVGYVKYQLWMGEAGRRRPGVLLREEEKDEEAESIIKISRHPRPFHTDSKVIDKLSPPALKLIPSYSQYKGGSPRCSG